jgi:multiple sugar transport system substrate-binding protein
MTNRRWLWFWLVVGICVLLVGGIAIAAEKPMFGPEAELKGEIRIYARSYTPREPTPADRWSPPTYLWKIIEEYQKIHPQVKVKIIEGVPDNESVTWTQTRLLSGTAPEIFWAQSRLEGFEWARAGLLLPFDEYLALPNPYVPGNEKWIDIFDPFVIAIIRAGDGKIYSINGDLVTTGIFYNRDVFKELGLSEAPGDWEEFMSILGKIKEAGYVPMSFQGGDANLGFTWLVRFIYYPLYKELIPMMDILPEEKPGVVTRKEVALAWKKGLDVIGSERFKTGCLLQEEFAQYWSPGFLGMDINAAYDQFITGKAVMHLNGSWQIKPIKEDPYREFQWGVFPFPPITKKTTKYAPPEDAIKPLTLGGPSAGFQFSVPKSVVEKGLLEEAIDFLMFLSAPQNAGPLIADLGAYMPSIKGAEKYIPEDLKAAFYDSSKVEFIDLKMLSPGYLMPSSKGIDKARQTWQLFMGEQIDLEEAIERWKKDMDEAWNELIEQNQWDFSAYGIE